MHTLLTPLTIVIASVAVLVLANIITYLIVIGGGSSRYAGPVTGASIEREDSLSEEKQIAYAKQTCECPCHRRPMHSGMRCLDCFGELCDEGTAQ